MVRVSKKDIADSKTEAAEARPSSRTSTINCVVASEVKPRKKHWLWPGHLLRGALEITSGAGGLGKSQCQCDLVAITTTGRKWPDGQVGPEPAYAIMLTAEDSTDQDLVPRLMAARADLDKVIIVHSLKRDSRGDVQFLLSEDIQTLGQQVLDLRSDGKDVALITLDPITAYMGGKMDSHQTTQVRSQLGPLKLMLEKCEVAMSAIMHPPKAVGLNAVDQFGGSGAFTHAPRICHYVCPEFDENGSPTGRALYTMAKTNNKYMPTLAYKQGFTHVVGDGADTDATPYIEWDGEVDVTADEALARLRDHIRNLSPKQEKKADPAVNFLASILRDGPKLQIDIFAAAKRQDIGESAVRRAAKNLKVVHRKEKRVMGKWWWVHPDHPGDPNFMSETDAPLPNGSGDTKMRAGIADRRT